MGLAVRLAVATAPRGSQARAQPPVVARATSPTAYTPPARLCPKLCPPIPQIPPYFLHIKSKTNRSIYTFINRHFVEDMPSRVLYTFRRSSPNVSSTDTQQRWFWLKMRSRGMHLQATGHRNDCDSTTTIIFTEFRLMRSLEHVRPLSTSSNNTYY